MRSNKQQVLFIKVVMGCAMLCVGVSAFAANWPLAPYGFAHVGPRFVLGWPLDRKAAWSFDDGALFIGGGALYNPSKLDDWFFSGEMLCHGHRGVAGERGVFVLGKLTVPTVEGIENFVGFGLGALWLTDKPKKDEFTSTFAAMLYMGRNWHMSNGFYLTMRGSYLFPFGKNRKQSLSITIGSQWNWV
jgi:hypothetical protein